MAESFAFPFCCCWSMLCSAFANSCQNIQLKYLNHGNLHSSSFSFSQQKFFLAQLGLYLRIFARKGDLMFPSDSCRVWLSFCFLLFLDSR